MGLGMTYRHALTLPLSALLFALSGCSGLDDPGGHDPMGDDPVEDPDADPDTDPDADPDAEPLDCVLEHLELAVDEAAPSGMRGKNVYEIASEYAGGEITFFDGDASGMTIDIVSVQGPAQVIHSDGSVEGCSAFTQIEVPADFMIISEDGRISDLFEATLVHHSDDPESVEVVVESIDFSELGGTLQAPKEIGPEANSAEAFSSLSLALRMVLGDPRPMASVGSEVLEEVHGVILGSGELAEWSCPDNGDEAENDACLGATRDFFIGSIRIKS